LSNTTSSLPIDESNISVPYFILILLQPYWGLYSYIPKVIPLAKHFKKTHSSGQSPSCNNPGRRLVRWISIKNALSLGPLKKYYAAQSDQDDLISIGTIGLIKAIASFDPKKGARLATYAARCIENEILMYFRSQKKQSCEISLSEPIDSDNDGNVLALMDVISYEDSVIENVDQWEKGRRVRTFISEKLDDREREIIMLRYGFGKCPPKTQREIALRCGISRSYVSRIEKRALKKLEKAFAQKHR